MNLPHGRGRIVTASGMASIVARCPLCGGEHHYGKGEASGVEIAEIRSRGFSDEWLPCQHDLPGNFWRIAIAGGQHGSGKSSGTRRSRSLPSA
jgi:hypothetical protein